MLQSMGSQRVRQDLAIEQQHVLILLDRVGLLQRELIFKKLNGKKIKPIREIFTLQNLESKELFFCDFKNFVLTRGIRKTLFTVLKTLIMFIALSPKVMTIFTPYFHQMAGMSATSVLLPKILN